MLNLILIIAFTVMAVRTARTVLRETAIFREFNQSRALGVLVLLFPLGPIVYFATAFRLGWIIAIVGAASCYLPALIAAKHRMHAFERAGTDRVKTAHEAATQAFGTALVGLIYCGIILTFTLVGASSAELGV